jgi:hypothetical protein
MSALDLLSPSRRHLVDADRTQLYCVQYRVIYRWLTVAASKRYSVQGHKTPRTMATRTINRTPIKGANCIYTVQHAARTACIIESVLVETESNSSSESFNAAWRHTSASKRRTNYITTLAGSPPMQYRCSGLGRSWLVNSDFTSDDQKCHLYLKSVGCKTSGFAYPFITYRYIDTGGSRVIVYLIHLFIYGISVWQTGTADSKSRKYD